ncbi:MAG: SurA N-terminal domain-containing protein [Candidatus Levybacteria bacterium]|nr:SurA N-terminal domain-containing protein [Candidatus Levybacteria bacterium]
MAARTVSGRVKAKARGRQVSVAQAAKKPRSRVSAETEDVFSEFPQQEAKAPLVRFRRASVIKLVILSIIVVIVVGFISYNRGFFVLATVNGQPIDRLTFIRETERLAGKRTMETLILKTLINQEAQKKNISVTQKEIDEKIKEIEKQYKEQGQDLTAVLSSQGLSKGDIADFVKQDLLMEKLVKQDIKVTGKEVEDYIAKNTSSLPQDKTQEEIKKEVLGMLTSSKVDEKKQALIAQLQKNAKIVNYTPYILPF